MAAKHTQEYDLCKTDKETYICLIDNKEFKSGRGLDNYINKKHNRTLQTYLVEQKLIDSSDIDLIDRFKTLLFNSLNRL